MIGEKRMLYVRSLNSKEFLNICKKLLKMGNCRRNTDFLLRRMTFRF